MQLVDQIKAKARQNPQIDVQLTVHFHSACFKETSVYPNHLELQVAASE